MPCVEAQDTKPSPSPAKEEAQPDYFQPSWLRALASFALALIGFLIPQEAPLEWYPLNNPSSGLHYLEMTMAARVEGVSETQVYLDFGHGFNELDSIRIPISTSERAYTYTFPLLDGPVQAIRLRPLKTQGSLSFTNFRILNRRNEEMRRFVADQFHPQKDSVEVKPTPDGWTLIVARKARDPRVDIALGAPIIAEGMNERNLKRCLLSWSYLTGMLWILIQAVYFALLKHRNWSWVWRAALFMVYVAALFSAVGNRDLIKNSLQYARFTAPPQAVQRSLEIELSHAGPDMAQVFWDLGRGFNEEDSQKVLIQGHGGQETLRFKLPLGKPLLGLRIDPLMNAGKQEIFGCRVIDEQARTRLVIPVERLSPNPQLSTLKRVNWNDTWIEAVQLETRPDARDPALLLPEDLLLALNRSLSEPQFYFGIKGKD